MSRYMHSDESKLFDQPFTPEIMVLGKGNPGDLYRLEGDGIPERIRAKNSLHQVDFLEALTLCQALDRVPHTVIIGVEPMDIETQSLQLHIQLLTCPVAPSCDDPGPAGSP